jgi:tripartite-type tricarboxylate transporter receptor subunit TctC
MSPQPSRRTLLVSSAVAAPALLSYRARADTLLPDKGLEITVGFVRNGGADLMARIIAPRLESRTGRHVSVVNRPGSTGAGAAEALKSGAADGSVIAFMPSTTLALSVAMASASFDPAADFAPVTVAGTFQTALAVTPKAEVRTLDEYVEWAKGPDAKRRRMGAVLTDALLQVYGKSIARDLGLELQNVSYRGSAPLVTDLEGNRVAGAMGGVTAFVEYHHGNRLRMIAVSGPRRLGVIKDVPTATELGHPNLLMEEWYGCFAAKGAPAPIVAEWNRQIRAVLAEPEVAAQLSANGLQVEGSTQEAAATRMAAHLKMWKDRMELLGLKPLIL